MRAVGVKELKNRLSEYVRLAASGEVVLVTDRDRVVAELSPPRPDRSPRLEDALLAEAVRKGWVTPPSYPDLPLPPRRPVAPLRTILRELEKLRRDR
ncbi:MAG TPA: type II toxin-antitoxin system prevent-host-death family antitoxin [Planctomycetota bacterium]|jgi:antitoxin (DNA-binding transcriptional repressor) of toxin-antitoxin stability system|nr:type II toxin-antitoxin system prevent-host-death family antitoxin [Planctomycetota bacterium]